MSAAERPTWKLKPVTFYTAECPHCRVDLLADDEFSAWSDANGVEESIAELDFCPSCNEPITENGWGLRDDAREMGAEDAGNG